MSGTLARLRSLCPTVSVGTLTADLMHLGAELELLERAGVGMVHIDVMDGCFCPQMTVGPVYVKGLRTPLLKDVHLMVHEPLDKLADYVAAGADIITVHVEAAVHIHRVLQRLGTLEHGERPGEGIVRGLALNPGTPLEWLDPLLDEVDVVIILGGRPGLERADNGSGDPGAGGPGEGDHRYRRQGHPGLRRRRGDPREHRRDRRGRRRLDSGGQRGLRRQSGRGQRAFRAGRGTRTGDAVTGR